MKTTDWIGTIMFRVLELSFIVGFFVLLIYICTKEIPPANKDLANILFGVLATIVAGIGTYEWGSSRGSDRKTEIMAEQNPPITSSTQHTTIDTQSDKIVETKKE